MNKRKKPSNKFTLTIENLIFALATVPDVCFEGQSIDILAQIPPIPSSWANYRQAFIVVRYSLDGLNEWEDYELKEDTPGGGLFRGSIPKEKTVPGTLYSYFRAQITATPSIKATAPTKAPTYTFISAVKARPFPWIGEYRGQGFGLVAARARIRRLKADASPSAELPKEYMLPLIKKPLNLAKCSVISDPRDGGVWIPHMEHGTTIPPRVRLVKFMSDGSKNNQMSQAVINRRVAHGVFDPVHNRLWLTLFRRQDDFNAVTPTTLAFVGPFTGDVQFLKEEYPIIDLSVDYVSGDAFVSLHKMQNPQKRGVFRIAADGTEKIFSKRRDCLRLVGVGDGELVCLVASQQPRIVHFDAQGNEKYSTESGNDLHATMDIAVDYSNKRLWSLIRAPNKRDRIIAYRVEGSALIQEREFSTKTVKDTRYFWSISRWFASEDKDYLWVYAEQLLAVMDAGYIGLAQSTTGKFNRLYDRVDRRGVINTFPEESELPGNPLPIQFTTSLPDEFPAGTDMPLTVTIDEESPFPVWVYINVKKEGLLSKSRLIELKQISRLQWKGTISRFLLDPGKKHKITFYLRGYGCYTEKTEEVQISEEFEVIEIKTASVPDPAPTGKDMTVSLQMAEYSKEPDSVVIHCRLNNSTRTFPLQPKGNGKWTGKVEGSFLVPGELKSYFEARGNGDHDFYPDGAPQETIITKVIQVTPVEKIKLTNPRFPKEIIAGYSATVSIGITKDSVMPDKVTLYAASFYDKDFFPFVCTQSANKRWKATIPASLLIPGKFKLYFYAKAKGSSGILSCRYPSSGTIQKAAKDTSAGRFFRNLIYPTTATSGKPINVKIMLRKNAPSPRLVYLRGRNTEAKTIAECFLSIQSDGYWTGSIPGNQVHKGTFLGHFIGFFGPSYSRWVEFSPYWKTLKEIEIKIK